MTSPEGNYLSPNVPQSEQGSRVHTGFTSVAQWNAKTEPTVCHPALPSIHQEFKWQPHSVASQRCFSYTQ